MAGLALSGGVSHQRRRDGMTIDNLVSAEVVLADGRRVRASAAEHADLYWALRGGGGNFGVVTSFELRLHPLGPEVFALNVAYPIEDAARVLTAWRDAVADAPDELSTAGLIWSLPAVDALPEPLRGLPYVGVAGMWAGDPAEGERATRALRELATPLLDMSGPVGYLDFQRSLDPFFPAGARRYWKALYLDGFSGAAIDRTVEWSNRRPSDETLVIVRHCGGAMARVRRRGDRVRRPQLRVDAEHRLDVARARRRRGQPRVHAGVLECRGPVLRRQDLLQLPRAARGGRRRRARQLRGQPHAAGRHQGRVRPGEPLPPQPEHPSRLTMTRDLRLLAGAVFLSAAGDLLALIVLALQVHSLSHSGWAVSALFATTLVPMVALAPLAGLVADRFESVRVLVVASLAQAAVAAALACTTDLAAILALASLLTAGNAFAQPAEFTLIPVVAGARRVTEATGVIQAARYAGFAAGPLLGAGLAAAGPQPALLVNAATFVAIAAAGGAMRARRPPAASRPGERLRALDGVRLLRSDPLLRPTIAAAVGALLFISASLTVEIFYLRDVVGASDAAYALVVCAWMGGMVVGATALARRVPARLAAAGALVALAVQGAGMGVQTAWAILPVAFAGYLVGGLGQGVKDVLLRSLIADRVPGPVHGRAFAAYNAARNTAELAAVGAGGLLVGALGPRAALVLAGLGPVLAAAAGLTALHRRQVSPRLPASQAAGRILSS